MRSQRVSDRRRVLAPPEGAVVSMWALLDYAAAGDVNVKTIYLLLWETDATHKIGVPRVGTKSRKIWIDLQERHRHLFGVSLFQPLESFLFIAQLGIISCHPIRIVIREVC